MQLFGLSLETVYLTLLIVAGALTILIVFFGDFFEGAREAAGFLNPTLILAFVSFFAVSAYILEKTTSLHSLLIIILSSLIALVLDALLNVFILIPIASAEESLVYTENSLKGRIGKIIIAVPENGFGEVLIENYTGRISKPAASFENSEIVEGTRVLVIEVKSGILYVVPYEEI